MMLPFSKGYSFCDEGDYIVGGIFISNGKIMYNDFINQHMPFLYFITAICSFLKAGSLIEFRLYFYSFIVLIYALIFLRNAEKIGKIKTFLILIFCVMYKQVIEIRSMIILADNLQTICMIALLLEFLSYLKDQKLDWTRSIIVSLCIFSGITLIFICIYEVFAIFIGVVIKEILYWKNCKKSLTLKNFRDRYYKLIISCAIPFLVFFIYLLKTNSINEFYKQAFLFNTQVYSNYHIFNEYDLGSNIFKPMAMGIYNFIQIIPDSVSKIMAGKDIITQLVRIITFILLIITIFQKIFYKQIIESITVLLFICFGFVRVNYDFHALSGYMIMIMLILLNMDRNIIKKIIFTMLAIIVIFYYIIHCKEHYKIPKQVISYPERDIINYTENNKNIFFDFYAIYAQIDPIYLVYKDIKIVNTCWFTFPWYMDWYEDYTIEELEQNKPKIVIYDKKYNNYEGIWENFHYADKFENYLYQNYILENESVIWHLKEY